jgi:hypothetical protein
VGLPTRPKAEKGASTTDYTLRRDVHKHNTQFAVLDRDGRILPQYRVDDKPGTIRAFLEGLLEATPVTLVSTCTGHTPATPELVSDRRRDMWIPRSLPMQVG